MNRRSVPGWNCCSTPLRSEKGFLLPWKLFRLRCFSVPVPDSYPFDLIFLDIDLGGMDGMALARKIRETDSEVPILFLTNHREYVFEGYEVQAFRYLLKPVTEDTLFPLLDELQSCADRKSRICCFHLAGRRRSCSSRICFLWSPIIII